MFWRKKEKRGLQEESPHLLERLSELEIRIKACERTLDEQHDFIRRLASRRAKEEQLQRDSFKKHPEQFTGSQDEPPIGETKADLRRRAMRMLRPGLNGESA